MIIDKLHSNYLLKRCREKPHLVQKRLDKIAATILLEELEHKLTGVLDNGVLLFIRDVDVKFKVNFSHMDDRTIAGLWSDVISSYIFDKVSTISKTETEILEESGIALFPDKATYYAHFIRDLTGGFSTDKWYYREFEGLKSIGREVALKLIFKQARDFVDDILLALEEIGALEAFLQTVKEEDAREFYSEYLKKSTESDIKIDSRDYETAFDVVIKFMFSSDKLKSGAMLEFPGSYKQCLKVYTLFKKEYPDFLLEIYTRRIIKDIVFKEKLQRAEEFETSKEKESISIEEETLSKVLEEAIPLEEFSEKEQSVGEGFKEDKELYHIKKEKDEEKLLQISEEEMSPEKSFEKSTYEKSEEFMTLYGGLFLLVPAILNIKLIEVITKSKFPQRTNLSPLNCFLFFLGMKIAGKDINELESIDPGIYLFAGLDRRVLFNMIERYRNYITPEMNADIVEQLIKELEFLKERSSPCLDYINSDDLIGSVNTESYDSMIKIIANLVLRVFARDLRGFEESSHEYLLRNFIERESKIKVKDYAVYIELAQRPLDAVLKLSGLLDYEIRAPWLQNKIIEIALKTGE